MQMGPILLVEDRSNDVFLLQSMLERWGIAESLHVVSDGEEAIKYLAGAGIYADRETHPFPSLVLLDLHLPKISGKEVLTWIRQRFHPTQLPVVILSGSNYYLKIVELFNLGADQYVVKGSMQNRLRDTLTGLTPPASQPVANQPAV